MYTFTATEYIYTPAIYSGLYFYKLNLSDTEDVGFLTYQGEGKNRNGRSCLFFWLLMSLLKQDAIWVLPKITLSIVISEIKKSLCVPQCSCSVLDFHGRISLYESIQHLGFITLWLWAALELSLMWQSRHVLNPIFQACLASNKKCCWLVCLEWDLSSWWLQSFGSLFIRPSWITGGWSLWPEGILPKTGNALQSEGVQHKVMKT